MRYAVCGERFAVSGGGISFGYVVSLRRRTSYNAGSNKSKTKRKKRMVSKKITYP
jgi:hypothetical protein